MARSRWTLALLRQHCPILGTLTSDSGVFRRLQRWRIRLRRGRLRLTSPDPQYKEKRDAVQAILEQALQEPLVSSALRVLFADEASFYRQPLVGTCWQERGKAAGQTHANLSHKSNTTCRAIAALDAKDGRVTATLCHRASVAALCRWLSQVRQAYGPLPRIVLVWDNWPVHKHERVLAAAQKERIELLFLPTYSPWLNPIEKLWRKMRQEVLYLHRHSDNWDGLKQRVATFLNQYTGVGGESAELLRYVGLIPKPPEPPELSD